ncbi:MAG: hypothetical protein HKN13_04750 [Rhodothermales bacterium]|nr:hypothetical protein [Rhodothermales bacterium]
MQNTEYSRSNPYVGLRPFFTKDRLYFFGRDQQTAEVLNTLYRERFLAVVGSSGCGKSSMVRAGLIPMLLGGFLVQDRDHWSIVRMKPGGAPIANLASSLADIRDDQSSSEDAAALEKLIREEHVEGVVAFLKRQLQSNENALILVDQFEELFAFRQHDEDEGLVLSRGRRIERAKRRAEAAEFVDLLLRLSERRELPVYVAMTMRTDFLGDCDVFFGLPEAMNRGRYLVPRLSRQQLREAIHGPVLLMRERIAPRLLDRLLNELGDRPDRLPVLQHALLRTWDAWVTDGRIGPIDIRHFEQAGGLERALALDAKRALEGLDRDATARIFKRLTDTDISQRRIRRPARVSELVAVSGITKEEVEEVVSHFHDDNRSFLYTSDDGDAEDPRVNMAHESLMRQWDDLRDWVDEERVSRDHFLELVDRKRAGKANLQDPDLQLALDWQASARPTKVWAQRYSLRDDDFEVGMEYLEESRKEAEAELLRERELAEKEKRLAEEEKMRLEADVKRRKRQTRQARIVTAVVAALGLVAVYLMIDAQRTRKALEEATGLTAASIDVINKSADMSDMWEDDSRTDREVETEYANLMAPLDLPDKLKETWTRRLDAMSRWDSTVSEVKTLDADDEVAVPEKMAAWKKILSSRSPRTGPDAVETSARADVRFSSLDSILTNSVEIREGTFAVCSVESNGFCSTSRNSCTKDSRNQDQPLAEGQPIYVPRDRKICVSFEAKANDAAQSATLTWTHDSNELRTRRVTGIVGGTFSFDNGLINTAAPGGQSEIKVTNTDGTLIYRRVLIAE